MQVNEKEIISIMIRSAIDTLDRVEREAAKARRLLEAEELETEDNLDNAAQVTNTLTAAVTVANADSSDHVVLGSGLPPINFQQLQNEHDSVQEPDRAYQGILQKVNRFLRKWLGLSSRTSLLMAESQVGPVNQCSAPTKSLNRVYMKQVTPYRLLKVNYVSEVDWSLNTDILRAHPDFHHRPRFDHAIVKVADSAGKDIVIFVQLLGLFKFKYQEREYKVVLVHPYDDQLENDPDRLRRDKQLRLTRVAPRSRVGSAIISIDSIIRGCLLADDRSSVSNEKLVVNFVDQDMWRRLKLVGFMRSVQL